MACIFRKSTKDYGLKMVVKNTNYSKYEIERMLKAGSPSEITISQQKLLDISEKIYLFDGIGREDILRITQNVKFRRFQKGDIIMSQGDKSNEIYFILNGLGVVVVGKNTIVANIESGNMFGEMAFLSKKPRNATILAHKEGTTIISFEINEDKCNDMYSYPFSKLYRNIALDLVKKVEASNKKRQHPKL